MKTLTFITGNHNKLREAREILQGYEIVDRKIDLPELQEMDQESIVEEKIREALRHLNRPLFIEDTGLYFDALNGLPGPFIKWFEQQLSFEQIYKLVEPFNNYNARVVCYIGYGAPGEEPKIFKGVVEGTIVPPAGRTNFGFDVIFIPEGYQKRYSEMTPEEKNAMSHRKLAFEAFKEFLDSR